MRFAALALVCAAAGFASAQTVTNVYDRDNHDQFKLKNIKAYSTTLGPLVRTNALFTFDNPAKKLTEASVWFELPTATALSGFGYFYKNEYVPGILMDKNKAWFIYTAITSRNEDPGILDQWSPTSYHAQIYPLAQGYDLRVNLKSIGFLPADNGHIILPKPAGQIEAPVDWKYRAAGSLDLIPVTDSFQITRPISPVCAVAQKFKDGRTYVAGTVRVNPEDNASFSGLRDVHVDRLNGQTIGFTGWTKNVNKMVAKFGQTKYSFAPNRIQKGPEAAQVWAQQKLAQDSWSSRKAVLDFSMKYQIPSNATALLAVPQEQMKLFKKKEAEYQRQEQEKARRQREWSQRQTQNWNRSKGGDPEIRVSFPGAEKVYAILPDGQVLNLRLSDGYWGTNFEIPANAAEGAYKVRITAIGPDGYRDEKTIQYNVDRTPPEGKISTRIERGRLVIEVRSEAGLAEVAAFDQNGSKFILKEVEPGQYRATFGLQPVSLTLMLKDQAGNKREIKCSWRP